MLRGLLALRRHTVIFLRNTPHRREIALSLSMIASLSHSPFCAPAIPQLIKTMISRSRTHKNHLWKSRDAWARLHELYNWIQGKRGKQGFHRRLRVSCLLFKWCFWNDQRLEVFVELFESESFQCLLGGVIAACRQLTSPTAHFWPPPLPSTQPDTLHKLLQQVTAGLAVSSPSLVWWGSELRTESL